VDLDIIARVKQRVDVPVIGNGDVVDLPSLERLLEVTGCDGVMVGRAALGNPWIFSLFRAWWIGQPPPVPPTAQDKLRAYLHQLHLYLEIAPAERAVLEMRKFAGWYLRGFHSAAVLRRRIMQLTTPEAIQHAVAEALS
jgi:tRNA-dihydrouridine synthase B